MLRLCDRRIYHSLDLIHLSKLTVFCLLLLDMSTSSRPSQRQPLRSINQFCFERPWRLPLLVFIYISKALPLLELAVWLPVVAADLLAILVSQAIGPLGESGTSGSPGIGPLKVPFVLSTAIKAADNRAFCFSKASSRASMRDVARIDVRSEYLVAEVFLCVAM